MKSDLIDIMVSVEVRTDKAIRVFYIDTSVWLPRSQIEIEEQPRNQAVITLPEWLAKEKGLI